MLAKSKKAVGSGCVSVGAVFVCVSYGKKGW